MSPIATEQYYQNKIANLQGLITRLEEEVESLALELNHERESQEVTST